MSIKRNTIMNSATRAVKKLAAPLLSALILCTSAIAPNAIANSIAPMVDKTVSVTFKMSELDAAGGTSAARLLKAQWRA